MDVHIPTKGVDTLRFHNGKAGEHMFEIVIQRCHRVRRSKSQVCCPRVLI